MFLASVQDKKCWFAAKIILKALYDKYSSPFGANPDSVRVSRVLSCTEDFSFLIEFSQKTMPHRNLDCLI